MKLVDSRSVLTWSTLGLAFAIGCGSEVSSNSGGSGGGSGAAGGTGGTTNVTQSVSATSTQSATSTTGSGNTACDQGCAKAAGCGLDACSFINPDCASGNYECFGNCILDADCAAINSLINMQNADPTLVGCLQGCNGGQGGGGGAGGGGTQAECAATCGELYDCGLEMSGGMQLCPGFDGTPVDRASFIQTCIPGCVQQPLLNQIVNPNNCSQSVNTVKQASAVFNAACTGMGSGGAGGAGGN